jgi:hypothetical protein
MANYNPNLIKIHRNYTYEELAMVFGIHKNTIAAWVKSGLPCLQERRPFLITGHDAKAFLQNRRVTKKQKCKQNELFCTRCKAPVKPFDNFVEYVPISLTRGRLTGFCERCESIINKFAGVVSLEAYSLIFTLEISKGVKQLNDTDKPLLNSDLIK